MRRIRREIYVAHVVLLVVLPVIGSHSNMGIVRDSPIVPAICRFVRATPDVLVSLI